MKQLLMVFLLLISNLNFAKADIDPFEGANRKVYQFNQTLDKNILKPTARVYQENVPEVAQTGVSNFFGNLDDISTLANQVLQFKPIESVTTFGRILINSTIGLGGLFDIASKADITTKHEDFGQTMAVWGVQEGPYVVLPLFGPANLRDGTGVAVDLSAPTNVTNDLGFAGSLGVNTINVVNQRTKLTPVVNFVNKSDDPYITVRSSYLQKRKFDVYDGNLPAEEQDF